MILPLVQKKLLTILLLLLGEYSFQNEDGKPAMILLDALKGKYDFPELKAVAMDQYKYWEPESVIIEAKATGEPLMQEFRRMGIPVIPFVPSRGKDKHSRVNACSPVFEEWSNILSRRMRNMLKKLLRNVQLFLMERTMTMSTVLHRPC